MYNNNYSIYSSNMFQPASNTLPWSFVALLAEHSGFCYTPTTLKAWYVTRICRAYTSH